MNLNNVWKWEIISTVLIEISHILADGTGVLLFFIFFRFILFIVSFGCVTIAQKDEKCQYYLIYDKANGDVARLEWVGDAFNDNASFGKSVKLKQK